MKKISLRTSFKGLLFISMILCCCSIKAQNVGIGTATPLKKLHIIGNVRSSTLAGIGSRIVLADSNGTLTTITGPTSPAWMTTGNALTIAGTHFIGTTDAVDWVVKTNNMEQN